MGFFDELVGDIIDIARKEAKRAIVDGLKDEFGQADNNVPFRRERQNFGRNGRSTQAANISRTITRQNSERRYRINNSSSSEEEGYKVAEDITENSEITQYQNMSNPLCIKANDRVSNNGHNFLDNNKKNLLKKYPQFGMADATSIDFFNTIIQRIFINITKNTLF